jgi:hypothetical protein
MRATLLSAGRQVSGRRESCRGQTDRVDHLTHPAGTDAVHRGRVGRDRRRRAPACRDRAPDLSSVAAHRLTRLREAGMALEVIQARPGIARPNPPPSIYLWSTTGSPASTGGRSRRSMPKPSRCRDGDGAAEARTRCVVVEDYLLAMHAADRRTGQSTTRAARSCQAKIRRAGGWGRLNRAEQLDAVVKAPSFASWVMSPVASPSMPSCSAPPTCGSATRHGCTAPTITAGSTKSILGSMFPARTPRCSGTRSPRSPRSPVPLPAPSATTSSPARDPP